MEALGRVLMFVGGALLVVGGLVVLSDRLGFPLGRLPGDFVYHRDGLTCIFPLATSLLLSLLLTLALNVLARWLR